MLNKKHLFVSPLILCVILISVLGTFTQYYSLGYLLLLVVSAGSLNRFAFFNTYTKRFMLSLLVLLAIIPIVSLFCWLIGTELLPIYNILGYGVFWLLLYTKKQPKQKITLFDRLDFISVLTAIIPVIVIAASFFLFAPNKQAALFQLTGEGWDNGSHILMLQDVSKEGGYIYGPWEELKKTLIQKSNAYPQAWHLSTAHFINGFGENRFVPHRPIQTLAAYMAACLGWLMLAAYILTSATGSLYRRISKKKDTWGNLFATSVTSLGIQSIVLYSSIAHGFPNYIATIVYILLITCLTLGLGDDKSNRPYILMTLFGVMAVLTWFLVFPAVALMIVTAILLREPTIKRSLLIFAKDWRLIMVLVAGLLAMLFQITIFQEYSEVTGSSQLNEGTQINPYTSTVGVFVVNQILLGITLAASLLFMFTKFVASDTRKYILAILIPWIIMSFGIYFYQNITTGYNSYYTSKVFGITLLTASIILIPAFNTILQKYTPRASNIQTICMAILAICLLLVGTGQSLTGVNKLFANNARTPYAIAEEIVTLLPEAVKNETKIVVITNHINNDGSRVDRHGMLEQRLLHQKLDCAYAITRGDGDIDLLLPKLAICADKLKLKQQTITVIASKETYSKIKALNRPNIKVVLQKDLI